MKIVILSLIISFLPLLIGFVYYLVHTKVDIKEEDKTITTHSNLYNSTSMWSDNGLD